MDESFTRSYECERLTESPVTARARHYYYPGASTTGGSDGILLKVQPEQGEWWLGTFAFGGLTPAGVSGIFTTPDPQKFCVVDGGRGYLVSADAPTVWERIDAVPITDLRPIRAQQIIVFATFCELVAYGKSGFKWRTKRLVWDGLKITEVTETLIKGEGDWNFFKSAGESFVVDLATGAHEGGAEIP